MILNQKLDYLKGLPNDFEHSTSHPDRGNPHDFAANEGTKMLVAIADQNFCFFQSSYHVIVCQEPFHMSAALSPFLKIPTASSHTLIPDKNAP